MNRTILHKAAALGNVLFLLFVMEFLCCGLFTRYTWGTVSLPQFLFFIRMQGGEICDRELLLSIAAFCGVLPAALAAVCVWLYCKFARRQPCYFNKAWFFIYLVGLGMLLRQVLDISGEETAVLYLVLFICYLVNQGRNVQRQRDVFVTLALSVFAVTGILKLFGADRLYLSFFEFRETDFYAQNFVNPAGLDFKGNKKRNVIIVFVESFEKRFSFLDQGGVRLKVADEDAIMFADFTEGYAQRWTQGAMFSAFTGVHIHYISDYFRYALYDKLKYNEKRDRILMVSNHAGKDFDFALPNMPSLGKIAELNGYQNLFVQGGDIVFSGTESFLRHNGFAKENIYGVNHFIGTPQHEKGKYWWGVDDKSVFGLFKDKISALEGDKPFLAVMFTLDLHRGNNPYFANDEEIVRATIDNLNDFIAWFKKQDFYENTTLVVLADHKRMGENINVGGGLYNAFFNVPARLRENADVMRRFNQIDIFPTVLEIMGLVLPERKAGVGTSLFSKEKTLAERFSYEQQEGYFTKIDRFYQKLWGKREMFLPFKESLLWKYKLIAHAGGRWMDLSFRMTI